MDEILRRGWLERMHLRAFMDEEKDEPTAAAAVAAMVQELGGSLAVVVVYSVKSESWSGEMRGRKEGRMWVYAII